MGQILIIDDENSIRSALIQFFQMNGFDVKDFNSANDAYDYILNQPDNIDLILTDLVMPGMSGKDLFSLIHKSYPYIPIIIMSGKATAEDAITLMKEGVFDFFIKPFENIDKLIVVAKKAIEWSKIKKDYELLKQSSKEKEFSNIIGRSKLIKNIFETIKQAAPTKATMLVLGETGTGKELIAEAIHKKSGRKGPLVKVNCSALTETLLESELFGHEKGSFTGAMKTKLGRFELANGGTIFLDEIGEISQTIQVKLLRVLQNKTFERVGGEKTISSDSRVVAATNKDLSKLVEQGKFREDLYWRLNVIQLRIPSLKERKEDIPLLIKHFIDKYSTENDIKIDGISPQAIKILTSYDWKGNVRELQNCIENMVVLCRKDFLDSDDIPKYIFDEIKHIPDFILSSEIGANENFLKVKFGTTLDNLEKKYIHFILSQTKNKAKTARILGIGRKTLYNKLRKYELEFENDLN